MLKLATVFTGIGAIEHALKKMNIEHEIVFACDNGDVDILKEEIPTDMKLIKEKLLGIKSLTVELEKLHMSDKEYLSDLSSHITKVEDVINKLESKRLHYHLDNVQIEKIMSKSEIGVSKLTENDIEVSLELLLQMDEHKNQYDKAILEVLLNNEFKLDRKHFKEAIVQLQMAQEKIKTLEINSNLEGLNTKEEKKAYVDQLYKGQEKRNFVKKSYMANYDIKEEDFHWNVSFIDGNLYKDEVDLFVGGSPCQSFSLVGKQRGLEDTRGTLFYEYARLIKEIKPKVFIYENVRAILSNDNGNTWKKISETFDELGYVWKEKILNAKQYGVPQSRERLFVVGIRKDINMVKEFTFPNGKDLETSMTDYLESKVPSKYYLGKKGVDFVISDKNFTKRYTQVDGKVQLCQKKNQQFNWHGDFWFTSEKELKEKYGEEVKEYLKAAPVIKRIFEDGTVKFYSEDDKRLGIQEDRPYTDIIGRIRKLTPRESLRLMGFQDEFEIVVSDTAAYQQSGNSIVVDVLEALVKEIQKSVPQVFK